MAKVWQNTAEGRGVPGGPFGVASLDRPWHTAQGLLWRQPLPPPPPLTMSLKYVAAKRVRRDETPGTATCTLHCSDVLALHPHPHTCR